LANASILSGGSVVRCKHPLGISYGSMGFPIQ